MAFKGTEHLAASVAGALVLAASTAAEEEEVPQPDVPRRPDTSSFHFASTFQVRWALDAWTLLLLLLLQLVVLLACRS